MVQLYRLGDLERVGHVRGKIGVKFPSDPNQRPPEFTDKSLVEMLTAIERPGYLIQQIMFDLDSGKHYIEEFAVNCADILVDSRPLVRGFVPEGNVHQSQPRTLYEIMPGKKELHVIPNPHKKLFYDAHKASSDPLCMVVDLDEVLEEFELAGFQIVMFDQGIDLMGNPANEARYEGEIRYR